MTKQEVDGNDLDGFRAGSKSPPEILRELATRFEEKDKLWGSAWKDAGRAMHRLFPDKFTEREWGRIVCLVFINLKIERAVKQWPVMSEDSLGDLITYGSMLASLSGEHVEPRVTSTNVMVDYGNKKIAPEQDKYIAGFMPYVVTRDKDGNEEQIDLVDYLKTNKYTRPNVYYGLDQMEGDEEQKAKDLYDKEVDMTMGEALDAIHKASLPPQKYCPETGIALP